MAVYFAILAIGLYGLLLNLVTAWVRLSKIHKTYDSEKAKELSKHYGVQKILLFIQVTMVLLGAYGLWGLK